MLKEKEGGRKALFYFKEEESPHSLPPSCFLFQSKRLSKQLLGFLLYCRAAMWQSISPPQKKTTLLGSFFTGTTFSLRSCCRWKLQERRRGGKAESLRRKSERAVQYFFHLIIFVVALNPLRKMKKKKRDNREKSATRKETLLGNDTNECEAAKNVQKLLYYSRAPDRDLSATFLPSR